MTENHIKELMKKYLNGTITKEEEKLLEEFDQKLLLNNNKSIFKHTTHKDKVYRRLLKGIQMEPKASPFRPWFKIAASLALLLGLGYLTLLLFDNPAPVEQQMVLVTKSTQWGQKLNIVLSDGTEVYLNSGSSITYPDHFASDIREVELIGEAFFDVAKNPDKPFLIQSGEVETMVLGTSFNVNTYPESEQIAVTVATGRVKVASKESEVFLMPHEQGVYHRKTKSISKEKIELATYLNWKEGILHFEDVALSKVIATLERWYGVRFVVENDDIGDCHLTASYDNARLDAILESIVYAKKGLQYEILDNKRVRLKGKCTD